MNKDGKNDYKCRCWNCREELIWGGDFTFEDYALEGEGIVTNLSCQNCGTYVESYTPLDETPIKNWEVQ